jgi:phosphoglycolate phosphatase-like HAD superfamily hydrolase
VIIEAEGWNPGGTIMVGDTSMDVMAGKNAGIATVGVTYGAMSEDQIQAAGPDFIISKFSALVPLVE